MSSLDQLEKELQKLSKSAPALPANGKKALVEWVPWINLVAGIFALLSAYWLWHWAHRASDAIDAVNKLSQVYGGGDVVSNHFGLTVWLALIALIVQGVVMLMAFTPLKEHKKRGWDLLFYGILLNFVYGVVVAFSDYGSSHLFSSLVGVVIGLYLLFQIRDSYVSKAAASKK